MVIWGATILDSPWLKSVLNAFFWTHFRGQRREDTERSMGHKDFTSNELLWPGQIGQIEMHRVWSVCRYRKKSSICVLFFQANPNNTKRKQPSNIPFCPPTVSLTDFAGEVLQSFNMKSNSCRSTDISKTESWWAKLWRGFWWLVHLSPAKWLKGSGSGRFPPNRNSPPKKRGDMAFPQVPPSLMNHVHQDYCI